MNHPAALLSAPARAFAPIEGSLCDRVLKLVARMPDEEWTTGDLAQKFDVPSNSVHALLKAAVAHDLLRFSMSPGDITKCWRAGPAFAAWAAISPKVHVADFPQKRSTPNLSAFEAVTPTRVKRRSPPTYLDPAAITIKKGVPVPPVRTGSQSGYVDVWAAMSEGDMVELTDRQASGLASYVKTIKGQCLVRRIAPGMKGVWRTG
jgi:hypothetical protein